MPLLMIAAGIFFLASFVVGYHWFGSWMDHFPADDGDPYRF